MVLTLGPLLIDAGIDPARALVIRHAFAQESEESGLTGASCRLDPHGDLRVHAPTVRQHQELPGRASTSMGGLHQGGRRPGATVVGGGAPRGDLHERNHPNLRRAETDHMADLRNRLVIGWQSPRTWRMSAATAARYPVVGIADAEPIPFPGFDRLILNHVQLQAGIREHRCASWCTALASVFGI